MMDYFLMALPITMSYAIGMALELKFKVDAPFTYWILGAFGTFLTFLVAALVGLL